MVATSKSICDVLSWTSSVTGEGNTIMLLCPSRSSSSFPVLSVPHIWSRSSVPCGRVHNASSRPHLSPLPRPRYVLWTATSWHCRHRNGHIGYIFKRYLRSDYLGRNWWGRGLCLLPKHGFICFDMGVVVFNRCVKIVSPCRVYIFTTRGLR